MRTGDRFGSYQLEERLAAGGMAEIYRARRVGVAGFAREVCIKRILPALCADPVFVEMFVDEARTGAQLRHGNIVAIDDFGEVDGQYFLAMELVSGVDLARLLRALARDGRACPIDAAAYLTHEVLRALDYAHRKKATDGQPLGIVHRDVSPHNVLVSFAGEIKLTDFGIAKAASRVHQTRGRVVKGKLAYMAPEQIYGRDLDGRVDLFALGVVVFEALAGRRPFTGANEPAVVTAILRDDRPALRTLRPDLPPAFAAVIDGLLASSLERRYSSAASALAQLAPLGLGAQGSRTLAAMLAHYFPGRASDVQGASAWFAPESLPRAPVDDTARDEVPAAVLDADVPRATAPDADATLVSDVLEATLPAVPARLDAPAPTPLEPALRVHAPPADEPGAMDDATRVEPFPAADATRVEPTPAADATRVEPTPAADATRVESLPPIDATHAAAMPWHRPAASLPEARHVSPAAATRTMLGAAPEPSRQPITSPPRPLRAVRPRAVTAAILLGALGMLGGAALAYRALRASAAPATPSARGR